MSARQALDSLLRADGETLYRRCVGESHHHHLVCRRCGAAVEVAGPAVERWAESVGVRKLELHVFPHNEPAIALYTKLGYITEGHRTLHYRRPDGSYADAILMAKLL